jgi:hypothetical protein
MSKAFAQRRSAAQLLRGHAVHVALKDARPSPSLTVRRSDPQLWERSKRDAVARLGGKFSARAMQLAVQLYKARGGKYLGPKPPTPRNALARWTHERWDYVGRPGQSRYLPEFVRAQLTPSQKRRTNRAKRESAAQWSRQPRDVAQLAATLRRRYWQTPSLRSEFLQSPSRLRRSGFLQTPPLRAKLLRPHKETRTQAPKWQCANDRSGTMFDAALRELDLIEKEEDVRV